MEKEMSFLDHLEELRWHILRAFAAIVVIAIFIFVYRKFVVDEILFRLLSEDFPTNKWLCLLRGEELGACMEAINARIVSFSPQEQFLKSIQVGFVGGFIVAFPYIIWELWSFIRPGLHRYEQRAVRGSVFVMSLLFFTGVAFGYFIIAPFSIQFFSNFTISDYANNTWGISKVIGLITQIILGAGVIFQMPVLMYYLAKMGLVTPKFLRTYRRHAVAILLLAAAIITPPDVMSQILIFIPLYSLYEISIVIAGRVIKRKEKMLAEEKKKEEEARKAAEIASSNSAP
ncbi:MAG: twin-arginine translocase subunit TatC [Bacteroidia bacterium]|nr:twin-arginine translocase subunit TatC [Bacteroidia bacterium]